MKPIIVTETRQSIEYNFYDWGEKIKTYVDSMYIKTGKLTVSEEYSVDNLSRIRSFVFKNIDDCIEFNEDLFLIQARHQKLKHDTENSIEITNTRVDASDK